MRYHKGKVYLCKDLIDNLTLSSPRNRTDLLDSDDNLASFNYSYKANHFDQESFTYLRRDLLEQYLSKKDLVMYQIVWGERDFYPADDDWIKSLRNKKARYYTSFYQAIEYKSKNND